MRRRFVRRNLTGNRKGFSDELNYLYLVGLDRAEETNAVVKLKDEALLGGFWFEGCDFEAATGAELQYLRAAFNQAGRVFDANWMIHIEAIRRLEHEYIDGDFREPVDQLIDDERRANAKHFRTHTAIFVTWRPSLLERTSWGQALSEFLGGGVVDRVKTVLEKQLEHFEAVLGEFEARLARVVRIRRMRCSRQNCELLQALNWAINGEWQRCRPPRHGMYLDTYLAQAFFTDGALRYGTKKVEVVTVQGYPGGEDGDGTEMGMLSELEQLEIEYRWSNRFIVLDYHGAHTFFGQLRKIWRRYRRPVLAQITQDPNAPVNEDAEARVAEVAAALSDLERRVWFYGHHTCAVVLMGDDRERVREQAKLVITKFQEAGFRADREGLNGKEAFKGTFPGHGRENVRKPVINMVQFADLAPLMLEWRGERASSCPGLPPNSPAIFVARTASGGAFHFHAHVGDLGHMLVIGPPGAGKSAFLAFLKSQWRRYLSSRVIAFDKGYSMLPVTLASSDAVHYSLGSDGGPALAPLAALDTEQDLDWAIAWVRSLFPVVTATQDGLLRSAVEMLAASTTKPEQRSLTALLGLVQDVGLREGLRYYTAGPGARVLNGVSDALRYARTTVFDLEELMRLEPAVVTPTLLYLFHRIERRLTGEPTLLIIDEAWLVLGHPLFAARLREWLKVLRRANCAVVLATQSLADVVDSPIRQAVLESCPTRVLLANPEAGTSSMRAVYREFLQLNDEQIQLIASAEKKRDYYYVAQHPEGVRSRRFTLELGPAALAFVGASRKPDLARVRALHAQYGSRWPAEWLKERGLESWSEAFVALQQEQQARRDASYAA